MVFPIKANKKMANDCQIPRQITKKFELSKEWAIWPQLLGPGLLFTCPERPVVRASFHNRHRRTVHNSFFRVLFISSAATKLSIRSPKHIFRGKRNTVGQAKGTWFQQVPPYSYLAGHQWRFFFDSSPIWLQEMLLWRPWCILDLQIAAFAFLI